MSGNEVFFTISSFDFINNCYVGDVTQSTSEFYIPCRGIIRAFGYELDGQAFTQLHDESNNIWLSLENRLKQIEI